MSSDDNPKLPQHVVVEILKRLPVKSLLRFRCVCRSWRSTVDDPCFVALHLNASALDSSNRHTVCLDWSHPFRKLCSVFSDESLTLPPQSQVELPLVAPDSHYVIIGSCNGLICVAEVVEKLQYICYKQIHLWNLFTRKRKVVLQPDPQHPILRLGFGFDARSNDYKIVRLRHYPGRVRKEELVAQIYSLSTDSWRILEYEGTDVWARGPPAVFFNGSLHWFLLKFNDLHYVYSSILSFDVAHEVFDEMALPEELCCMNLVLSVAVVNGLLAVLISCKEEVRYGESCSVWVMREYGVPESWTKLYTFETCTRVKQFYGFTRNSEVLMVMADGGRVSWNPITRQFKDLPFSTKCDVGTIVESLVSL
ncbi:F-box/kelch-repeat protein At3g23880-like [Rhodamnia argentea]|uniref:F-box/kelch-repeat protein At3g23880-like n=1 Tax=Rhodamnia argentea TaxID=178133 RepID=A0ABM3HCI3_9MYRT|nr:F-box/kelch-repeat protein At3g23880-like [Rhodamnia argentea]